MVDCSHLIFMINPPSPLVLTGCTMLSLSIPTEALLHGSLTLSVIYARSIVLHGHWRVAGCTYDLSLSKY